MSQADQEAREVVSPREAQWHLPGAAWPGWARGGRNTTAGKLRPPTDSQGQVQEDRDRRGPYTDPEHQVGSKLEDELADLGHQVGTLQTS